AILNTGIQVHQRPNRSFYMDINSYVFETDAQIIKFDRENLTAIMISDRPVTQFTDTIFDVTAVYGNEAATGAFTQFQHRVLENLDDQGLRNPLNLGDGADGHQEGTDDEDEEEETAMLCSDNDASAFVALE